MLLYLDVIFGSYCVAIAAAAWMAWLNGHGSLRTVIALLAFIVVNGAISQVSHYIARPSLAEVGRVIAGTAVAPLAYLATDAPFGMWWPGFMIMALGGATFFGLLTGSAVPGRLVALYYAGVLLATEYLANPQPNWYAFSVGAGAIVMVGFLLAEMVGLLDRALAAQRDQSEALRLEKARSEQLLQKEAEAALRASEEHFRTLIEHSSDGISIVGRDRRIRYLSPAAERIVGRSTASVTGQGFEAFIHPDDRDLTHDEFTRQLASPHDVRVVETRIVRPDGAVRQLEIVGRVLPNGDVVGNLRDITERRQMDRAFRAIVGGTAGATGGDFFRMLVEHLATALGVDHAFVAEVIGTPPTTARTVALWSKGQILPNVEYELSGTPCEDVIVGGLGFCACGVQQAFPADRDLVALGAESYFGMPLYDTAGRVLGHVAVLDNRPMGDETRRQGILRIFAARAGAEIERQRAECALMRLNSELEARVSERTSELRAALDESSRLSGILEATPDIVGIASLDGRLRYANRAGRARLGIPADEPIDGLTMADFYTASSLEVIATEGIPTAVRRGHWSGEVVMRNRGGQEFPVSLAGTAHFDSDGAPRYLSCIARDISASKRIEAELQQAKEAAEAASRTKSTFLATMSHEIRTPMNAVIGMADLLRSTPLTAKQRDFVETIRAGGDALLTVINDILDFSKIEAGKLDLEQRTFDLRAALESAVDLLAPRAAEKGLELALSIDPAVPPVVVGDEARIRQIVVNLAGNGIKFTERGEVVVSVAPNRGDEEAPSVELLLTVRDTGIGVPAAKRDRLFRSFSQLDASTTREYGGTGLGLAISKRLVEMMGGVIWVESEGVPGRGSVFHFTIRVGRASVDERPSPIQLQPMLAGRRVLVVDDNATNRQILGLQLQSWGMLAVEAAAPSDALELVRRRDRFDLVLLDMQLPGMDGLSLARALCAQQGTHRLPMILLTSLGRLPGADVEAMACFAGLLTKPIKSSQLYDAIVAAIEGRDATVDEEPAAGVGCGVTNAAAPLSILLAEDMEVNCKFALLALEELGYRADVAVNGVEVIRALERQPYDVILMDVQMPEMDGLEATRRIRRDLPRGHQPHIVAMTANAMEGDRDMCLSCGMDDYLSKPVYLAELRAALHRAVERRATRRTAGAPLDVSGRQAPDSVRVSDEPSVDGPVPDPWRAQPASRGLAELFVKEAGVTLEELQLATRNGDVQGVRQAAHRIKGSSGYFGAGRVVELSARIERTARADDVVDPSAVAALGEELGKLFEALTAAGRSETLRSETASNGAVGD